MPLIETPSREGARRIYHGECRICTGRPVVKAAVNDEHSRALMPDGQCLCLPRWDRSWGLAVWLVVMRVIAALTSTLR